RVQEPDRRRSQSSLCLPSNGEARQAFCGQFRAANILQVLPAATWRWRQELTELSEAHPELVAPKSGNFLIRLWINSESSSEPFPLEWPRRKIKAEPNVPVRPPAPPYRLFHAGWRLWRGKTRQARKAAGYAGRGHDRSWQYLRHRGVRQCRPQRG